jgi:hypothetical protein
MVNTALQKRNQSIPQANSFTAVSAGNKKSSIMYCHSLHHDLCDASTAAFISQYMT